MTVVAQDVIYAELANGTHIIMKRRDHLPLVSIAIGAPDGSLLEPRKRAGLTALMARTSIKGTAQRTATQIAVQAERMGGSVAPSGGTDLVDWEISVPSRHFTDALELLCDVAFNANFPTAELEVERKLALADLQQTRDDMYRYPLRLCLQNAFPDHPYGYTLEDLEQGVAAATSAQLGSWREARIHADPYVLVVGDVDPELALREIERFVPQPRQISISAAPTAKWPAAPQQRVEQRQKAQSALAIGFPAPHRNHDDVYALQVLANAVGGLGGRFFEELRSKRSLAYTVALLPMFRVAGGAFVGYIATSPDREAEARAGLFEQFALLTATPLADDEVERAQRYTIGSWQIRNQTNAAQLNELLQAHLLGPGITEITEFEARIRAVDAQQIQEVARRYFKPEVAVEGVVRGTGKSR
jgi:zinc protease